MPRNMQEISLWLLEHVNREDLEDFICRAWLIWSERCRFLQSTEEAYWRFHVRNKVDIIEEYRKSIKEEKQARKQPALLSPVKWSAPPVGHLRLDVDVSFPEIGNCCGIGGVVRNHVGHLGAAFGRRHLKPGSVLMGELLAIKRASYLLKIEASTM